MNTTTPTLRLFQDTRRVKNDQTYPVKLTVYYKGEKLRFKTKISLTKEDWKKINGERLKDLRLKGIKKEVEKIIRKAETIVENIENFSFDEFAKHYYSTATIVGKKMI